jgi:hypothetical protein
MLEDNVLTVRVESSNHRAGFGQGEGKLDTLSHTPRLSLKQQAPDDARGQCV